MCIQLLFYIKEPDTPTYWCQPEMMMMLMMTMVTMTMVTVTMVTMTMVTMTMVVFADPAVATCVRERRRESYRVRQLGH